MGKKTKLDLVPIEENGASKEPTLDLVAIEEPVKKKDPTVNEIVSENGTTLPGSTDSAQPVPKPTEPSKEVTTPEEDHWLNKIGDFFAALPRAAVTSAYNVIANQIPQEFKTEDLRLSHGSFADYMNPSERDGQSNVRASGFEFKEADNLRSEYAKWINKQDFTTRSLPNNQRLEKFFETQDQLKVSKLRDDYQQKIADYRLSLEADITKQKKESEAIIKDIPQSVREIESIKDVLPYAGQLAGQGVGRIVTSALTAGAGSIIAERSAVFDRQLDQMAEIVSKKTGADPDIARRMIIKYQQDNPEEGRVIADLAALLDIVSIPAATSKVGKSIVGPAIEGLTETIQSEAEELAASKGSGADYQYDPIRTVDSFLGGVLGAKGVQMMLPSGKSTDQVIKEESAAIPSGDIAAADQAAANIIEAPKQQETTVLEEVSTPEPKPQEDAVQERSTESVLQRQPEETGTTGSERGGVESVEQRAVTTGEGTQVEEQIQKEEKPAPAPERSTQQELIDEGSKLRKEADEIKKKWLTKTGVFKKNTPPEIITRANEIQSKYNELKSEFNKTLPELDLKELPFTSRIAEIGKLQNEQEAFFDKEGNAIPEMEDAAKKNYERILEIEKQDYAEGYNGQVGSAIAETKFESAIEDLNETFKDFIFEKIKPEEETVRINESLKPTEAATSDTTQAGTPNPPAPPPIDTKVSPNELTPPNSRETIVKLREESNLPSEMKEGIEQFQEYTPRKRSQAQNEARSYIQQVGEDKALQEASKFKIGRSQEQKIAVLSELAEGFSTKYKEALNSGDQEAQTAAYNKFISAMDALSSTITDTAQALSYLNLVGTIFETKVGANRFAKQQIEESREGALKNYEPMVMNAKKIVEEFDKLGKEDFMKSKQVQDLIAKYAKPKSIKSRIAAKQVKDAAENLRKVWESNKSLGIIWDPKSQAKKDIELQKAVIQYIKAIVKKLLVDTGEKIQAIRDEVVNEVKIIAKDIGIEVNDSELSGFVNSEIDKVQISEAEKKYKKDLKQAVNDFISGNIKSKEELISKIVESEELDSDQATKFADSFDKIFSEYATKKKEQIIKKYTPKESPKQAKMRKEFYDKVIELSNSGAVSDQQFNDAIASIFDLPQMTPEITQTIDNMVEDINKAPVGRFKNIAITKLTDYIVQQQKFNVTNYLLASYKAGIFSGIDTQALNLQGNFFNVLELGFILGINNPMTGAKFMKAMANPKNLSRAGLEALEVIRTGYDPRMPGDKRRVLEQTPRSFFGIGKPLKGWRQAFDPTLEQQKKYVFRALSAGDLLFSTSINDALQYELYRRAAKKQGLSGKEASKYIREQMGYTPENIQNMGELAQKEAQDGAIPNDKNSIALRTYELIEQQRDPDIVEKSRSYASEQIMTNSPKGFIGEVARSLNQMISRLPVLSAFIPVVNFAANAMSRAVQYMPHTAALRVGLHGADRWIKGETPITQWRDFVEQMKKGDIDTEMRLRRAAVGMISMALMIGLTDEDEEGDNLLSQMLGKTVKVHGFGPGTQFNRQKNYQKQESGWIPYSIQVGNKYIPYRNYPALNVLLATIGEWNDAKRYGKLDRKDATERFIFALGNSFKVISEMGFLTSLNTLTSALLEGDVKSLVDVPTRTVQGFAFPKFQRNLTNLFDNKLYSRNNVQELVTRSIPVINQYANEPLVNALGEPIEKNWWDRIALWQESAYSQYEPLWEANNDKQYYFPVPSKFNIEQKFDRSITSKEYNDYFKKRGQVIISEWSPEMLKLDKDAYKKRMDKIVRYADYRALVDMGVMDAAPLKDIKFQLFDLYENQDEMREMKKQIKP